VEYGESAYGTQRIKRQAVGRKRVKYWTVRVKGPASSFLQAGHSSPQQNLHPGLTLYIRTDTPFIAGCPANLSRVCCLKEEK
jgi:hypothetical protein